MKNMSGADDETLRILLQDLEQERRDLHQERKNGRQLRARIAELETFAAEAADETDGLAEKPTRADRDATSEVPGPVVGFGLGQVLLICLCVATSMLVSFLRVFYRIQAESGS